MPRLHQNFPIRHRFATPGRPRRGAGLGCASVRCNPRSLSPLHARIRRDNSCPATPGEAGALSHARRVTLPILWETTVAHCNRKLNRAECIERARRRRGADRLQSSPGHDSGSARALDAGAIRQGPHHRLGTDRGCGERDGPSRDCGGDRGNRASESGCGTGCCAWFRKDPPGSCRIGPRPHQDAGKAL